MISEQNILLIIHEQSCLYLRIQLKTDIPNAFMPIKIRDKE